MERPQDYREGLAELRCPHQVPVVDGAIEAPPQQASHQPNTPK